MNWAVGVTTVPQRRSTLLPRTLASLAVAGFAEPWLFVDGPIGGFWNPPMVQKEYEWLIVPPRRWHSVKCAFRDTNVGVLTNWLLGLHELWLRNPRADRFLMAQDDVVFVRNLRQLLEKRTDEISRIPCYWNLYNPLEGHDGDATAAMNLYKGLPSGFYETPYKGKGALALVFDNPGVQMLLRSPAWAEAVLSGTDRATKRIDGTISSAFRAARGRELVHWPSLCQHVGEESTLGNPPGATHKAPSFPGESFDATEWLK